MQIPLDSWPVKIAIIGVLLAAKLFVQHRSPVNVDGERSENAESFGELLDAMTVGAGLVLFIVQPFLLQAFWIPSGSMEDTLRVRDRLLVSKMIYRLREPRFQDVVVFRAPEASGSGGDDFIKRCIGTPGHVIEVRNRRLFRDGRPVSEAYPKWNPMVDAQSGRWLPFSYDMKIVDGHFFRANTQRRAVRGRGCEAAGRRFLSRINIVLIRRVPRRCPPGSF